MSAYEKMPTVFPHLRQSPVVGVLNPGGARRGLTRRRAAQHCRSEGRPFLLVIEWAAELSCDTDRSFRLWPVMALCRVTTGSSTAQQAARVMVGSWPQSTLAGWSIPAEPARLGGLQLSSCDINSEGLQSC